MSGHECKGYGHSLGGRDDEAKEDDACMYRQLLIYLRPPPLVQLGVTHSALLLHTGNSRGRP